MFLMQCMASFGDFDIESQARASTHTYIHTYIRTDLNSAIPVAFLVNLIESFFPSETKSLVVVATRLNVFICGWFSEVNTLIYWATNEHEIVIE